MLETVKNDSSKDLDEIFRGVSQKMMDAKIQAAAKKRAEANSNHERNLINDRHKSSVFEQQDYLHDFGRIEEGEGQFESTFLNRDNHRMEGMNHEPI